MKNKQDGLEWRIIVVYGSPYEEGKQEFISELHEMFISWQGSTLIGVILTLLDIKGIRVMGMLTLSGVKNSMNVLIFGTC